MSAIASTFWYSAARNNLTAFRAFRAVEKGEGWGAEDARACLDRARAARELARLARRAPVPPDFGESVRVSPESILSAPVEASLACLLVGEADPWRSGWQRLDRGGLERVGRRVGAWVRCAVQESVPTARKVGPVADFHRDVIFHGRLVVAAFARGLEEGVRRGGE